MPQEKFCGIFFKEKTMDINDDLISRKSLIDSLNKFAPEHYNALINMLIEKEPVAQKCGACSRRKFYMQGYEAGKREAQQWIPCRERLPEEPDNVEFYPLVYVTTIYGNVGLGFYRCKDKEWYLYDEYWSDSFFVEANKIIAWMPKPEPYKETN